MWFVCMFVFFNAECQGNPKPPSFSSCLFPILLSFLPFLSSLSPPSPSLPLPSGSSEQTSDRSAQTAQSHWCGVNGAHFIPPNLTAKTSVTALPINSCRQAINDFLFILYFHVEYRKYSLRSLVIVIECQVKGNWTLMIFRYCLSCLLCPLVSVEEYLLWHKWHVAELGSISALIYGSPGSRNK